MDIQQDSGLSALFVSTEEERVCTGFVFTEGPVWIASDNCLVFSDIHSNRTYRWRPGSDSAEVYREPSNHGNGNTLDLDGNVLTCEHFGRRVAKTAYGGGTETLIDSFEGKSLHSPNDVVVHSSGAVYFTDPDYGYNRNPEPVARELDFQGVYRVASDGSVSVVEDRLEKPNGLTFSPDESLLYIADSSAQRKVWRYEVNADGSLGDRTLFADMEHDERPGVPDGMKVDTDGRLWSTGAGGVWVLTPEGELLGVFETAEHAANLAFGGPDWSTLYLTANTSVYRVETAVTGIAPHSR